MNRRGVTLLELVVALTLTALLAILAGLIQARAAALLRDRSERMGLEQALRTAAGSVRQAGESLGKDPSAGADLALVAPTRFVARMVRAAGVVCEARPAGVVVRSGSGWWAALRAPVAGRDSLLLLGITPSAAWTPVALAAAPLPDRCPDGTAATFLAAALPAGLISNLGAGAPIRVFEPVEFRAYTSASSLWLGVRAVTTGEAIQPLAGPFASSSVTFTWIRSDGSPALVPSEVAGFGLGLVGVTEHAGGIGIARMGAARTDSASILVALRNTP